MSKVSAESSVQALAELALSTIGDADVARMPAHSKARLAPGFAALKSTAAHCRQRPMDRPKLMRTPQTRERLHRLRHELGRISPPPSTIEEARAEIIQAMARADLGAWRVPELTGDAALHHADGSVQIVLIAHVIVFNSTGAFQIVDTHPPGAPYFEMRGRDGAAFVPPCDMHAEADRNVGPPQDETSGRAAPAHLRRA
ncbi:hypothetical protein IQ285_26715 [Burkholderia sp. R-69608]|uniref:hypothetical protein n=1 Tax=Paraburkholderia nemoris TaxID=2793076 RepID=UPI001911B9F1|nr:hypothetical protein [Paraburkholderia nemoris]MBK5151292.1 hypothetical protein [Burkholderia sp. R-69608]